MNTIKIIKASGESVNFSEKNIRHSLQRAGATSEQIKSITKEVNESIYDGITTKKIYKQVFGLLRDSSRQLAARYNLKKAIMELGPSGFAFEVFFAEILNRQGYKTKIGQFLKGQCVTHEVDVVAEKDNHVFMVECKYHNQLGKFCDVQIPLYIQSRFKDVESEWLKLPSHKNKIHTGWVVTNTRFSTDAVRYGTCAGLSLLGWDYPQNNGLKDLIDRLGLYPVTCLTSLTKVEKQHLLSKKIVLCKEIYDDRTLLQQSGVNPERITTVMKEAEQLCNFLIKNNTNQS